MTEKPTKDSGADAAPSWSILDTDPAVARMVAARYAAMTPLERLEAVVSINAAARAIVESSLPPSLTGPARRLAFARRFYGNELPEAALLAYAHYRPRRD